jgi:hypothetical protein
MPPSPSPRGSSREVTALAVVVGAATFGGHSFRAGFLKSAAERGKALL